MARRNKRQRTTSYGRVAPPRQTSSVGVFKIGNSYMTGRRTLSARRSLPRSVLPSLVPWHFGPTVRPGAPVRRPARPVVQVIGTRAIPARRISTRLFNPRDLALTRNPVVKSKNYTPCQMREQRKEVLFSLRVAGKKWGRGGPRMENSRRTLFSNYTCR